MNGEAIEADVGVHIERALCLLLAAPQHAAWLAEKLKGMMNADAFREVLPWADTNSVAWPAECAARQAVALASAEVQLWFTQLCTCASLPSQARAQVP